jgi:hypothetical protein
MKLRVCVFQDGSERGVIPFEDEVVGDGSQPFGGPRLTTNEDGTTCLSWHLPHSMIEMDLQPYELATLGDAIMTIQGITE